jgi:hypothetical protein
MAVSRIEKFISMVDKLEINFSDEELNASQQSNMTVKRNKNLELVENEHNRLRAHLERKRSLGHRTIVLRCYIRQCFGTSWVNDAEHWNEVEDLLDCALKENNYDLEKAIDYYREIAPKETIIIEKCKCGYMQPFCSCPK